MSDIYQNWSSTYRFEKRTVCYRFCFTWLFCLVASTHKLVNIHCVVCWASFLICYEQIKTIGNGENIKVNVYLCFSFASSSLGFTHYTSLRSSLCFLYFFVCSHRFRIHLCILSRSFSFSLSLCLFSVRFCFLRISACLICRTNVWCLLPLKCRSKYLWRRNCLR